MNEDALTKRGYAYEILDGEEVNITVKGKSSIVRSMGISDFQAIADFSKLSKVDAVPMSQLRNILTSLILHLEQPIL